VEILVEGKTFRPGKGRTGESGGPASSGFPQTFQEASIMRRKRGNSREGSEEEREVR